MVPANAPETHAQLAMRHNVQTYFTGRTASVLGSYYTAHNVSRTARTLPCCALSTSAQVGTHQRAHR